jgi:hypothetical protein
MVFKWVIKFLKYLSSALKKDATLQHKEEKVVAKEKNILLDEIIRRVKEKKGIKKITNESLQVLTLSEETIPFLESFIANIQLYLKLKEEKYTHNAKEKFNYVLEQYNLLIEHWKKILDKLSESVKNLQKILDKGDEETKHKLGEENKTLHREYQNLTKSAKKGANLDQTEKEAIIKKKMDLLRNHLVLLDKHKAHSENILKFNKNHHEKVKSLLDAAEKLNQKIHQHQKNWKAFLKLLKKVLSFLKQEESLCKEILASEEELNKILAEGQEIEKKINALIKKKEIQDKVYKSFLIKEEVAQQKGDGEIPKAA